MKLLTLSSGESFARETYDTSYELKEMAVIALDEACESRLFEANNLFKTMY
jgi:hypothetical protein